MAFKLYGCGVLLVTLLVYVNSASLGCSDTLEVVAVVDGSDSIIKDEFTLLKNALIDLTGRLNLSPGYVRFGVVLYSSGVEEVINLSNDRASLINQINNLPHPRDSTNTHLGIQSMINLLLSQGRTNVDRIGIVITDGVSKNVSATRMQAQLAKNNGITMYSVGVGLNREQDKQELRDIASSSDKAIDIGNYNKLGATLKSLLPASCPSTTSTTTTTTTTTRRPPISADITPTTRSSGSSVTGDPRLCEGCVINNGIGFIRLKDNCHQFIKCEEDRSGNLIATIHDCPGLTIWDNATLTCNFANLVECPNDPCKRSQYSFYKKSTNCRHYYGCNDTAAMPMCCPRGQSFNVDFNSCQPDSSCQTDCLTEIVNDPPTQSCNRRPGKAGYYMETIPGSDVVLERLCPSGTSFNQTTCDCTNRLDVSSSSTNAPVNTQCRAEVNIRFDSGKIEDIANRYWIQNEGVIAENGYGYFDGNSGLRILRFSNFAMGKTVRIKMRYRVDGIINRRQALLSNFDCAREGSLSFLLDGSSTSFDITTDTSEKVELPVSVSQQSQWQDLEFDLRNGQLTGSVGNTPAQQTSVNGGIATSECALQIGRGKASDNFKGYIDYIEVYLC